MQKRPPRRSSNAARPSPVKADNRMRGNALSAYWPRAYADVTRGDVSRRELSMQAPL